MLRLKWAILDFIHSGKALLSCIPSPYSTRTGQTNMFSLYIFPPTPIFRYLFIKQKLSIQPPNSNFSVHYLPQRWYISLSPCDCLCRLSGIWSFWLVGSFPLPLPYGLSCLLGDVGHPFFWPSRKALRPGSVNWRGDSRVIAKLQDSLWLEEFCLFF